MSTKRFFVDLPQFLQTLDIQPVMKIMKGNKRIEAAEPDNWNRQTHVTHSRSRLTVKKPSRLIAKQLEISQLADLHDEQWIYLLADDERSRKCEWSLLWMKLMVQSILEMFSLVFASRLKKWVCLSRQSDYSLSAFFK